LIAARDESSEPLIIDSSDGTEFPPAKPNEEQLPKMDDTAATPAADGSAVFSSAFEALSWEQDRSSDRVSIAEDIVPLDMNDGERESTSGDFSADAKGE
jgi:hypothetical protein